MNLMNISLDLNLLKIADSLYRHLNVSLAAQELGLSQSAVSHSLKRLRDHYGDPLFVRISKGVAPTRFALSIRSEIETWVQASEKLSRRKEKFDPKTVRDRITLATTDYFEVVVMPKLLPILEKEAPELVISLRPTYGGLPKTQLEDGSYDLAVAGFYEKLPEGFYKTHLFKDEFAAAYRKDGKIKRTLTREEYFSKSHALITLQGDFDDDVSTQIQGREVRRKIKYGSASFTGPAWILANSDLVLTAPRLLLERYREFFPLEIIPTPVPIDGIQLQMLWHKQTHADPLRVWFRKKLKEICTKWG